MGLDRIFLFNLFTSAVAPLPFLLDLLLAFWLAEDAGTAPCDSAAKALLVLTGPGQIFLFGLFTSAVAPLPFLLDLLLAFWLAVDAGTALCDSPALALPTDTVLLVPVALTFLVPLLVADQSTRGMLC
jgi:hypothetical protein